ncbi:uncharacterized protein LOC114936361 [Nylanderia fulva]|uniref:uncharacterized protein LOC114936361 n=1 Tax=Nylanderia fulva TaxID=613905 RepID=UPI0010FB4CD3|nr:uncharacterized protein LOC114936361 [Nylanderia fulva]
MAGGNSWEEATARANLAVNRVVRLVRQMGLKVPPQKTEAIFLHDGSHGAPPRAHIYVEDTPVEGVRACLKYLGLHLDSKWTFKEHFRQISPRWNGQLWLSTSAAQPRGTGAEVSEGCTPEQFTPCSCTGPSLSRKTEAARGPRNALRQVQKRVANRICKSYRTVS